MGLLGDMGEGLSSFGKDLTSGGDGSFSNFIQRVPEGMWRNINGGWGGLGTMFGSFFGQNEDMPGLRILWAPLAAAGGAAAGGAAAGTTAGAAEGTGGTAAGGSTFVGDIPLAGEGGSIYSGGDAAAGSQTQTPYWQRLLRNQAITRGIGLLSNNGGGQQGGNNTVSTPSSGFYATPQQQQRPMQQPQQQPTLASQNQASNQQLGMGGLLQRRNQSGYGRPYG